MTLSFSFLISFCSLLYLLNLVSAVQVNGDIVPAPLPHFERCTYSNTHELRRNKDCHRFRVSGDTKYCHQGDQLCKRRVFVDFRPSDPDNGIIKANEKCSNGFHPGEKFGNSVREMPDGRTPPRCFSVAGWGCKVTGAKASTTVCVDFSLPDPVTNDCTRTTTDTSGIINVRLGGECGHTIEGKQYVCGYNLYCNSNRRCVKAADINEACDTTSSYKVPCLNGLTCMSNRCIKKYELPFGHTCERGHHIACATGYCTDAGVCGHTLTNTECTRDADCVTPSRLLVTGSSSGSPYIQLDQTKSVCFFPIRYNYYSVGKCSAVYQPAAHRLEQCLYDKCREAEGENGLNSLCIETKSEDRGTVSVPIGNRHPCATEWVRRMCAEMCVQPSDRRYSTTPYIFDCRELTSTFMSSSHCDVITQFRNCDAVYDYPSSASRIAGRIIVSFIVVVSTLLLIF